MTPGLADRPAGRREIGLVGLLTVLSLFLAFDQMRGNAVTVDEPVHLAAGVEIVREGTGRFNPEHPPLAKALAGIGLIGTPLTAAGNPLTVARPPALLVRFLSQNSTPLETIAFRARLPFLAILGALLIAVYVEARRRFGSAAGLLALALCGFQPNLLAHASVVHTDLTVTLWIVLSLRPLSQLGDISKRWSGLWLGVFWGLAFLSKFSAPLIALSLLPLALSRKEEPRAGARILASRFAQALAVAALVILGGYALAYRNQSQADRELVARQALLLKGRSETALRTSLWIGSVSPPAGHAFTGLAMVYLQSKIGVGGPVNYFLGTRSVAGNPLYFPFAIAVKATLALLSALLLAVAFRESRRFALLFLAGFSLFLAVSARSTYNIGVRHVLFFFPVAAIAAAGALAEPAPAFRRRLLAGLGLAAGLETVAVHPFYTSFFNVAAGGNEAGHRYFADSNVDWGQDLRRLARRAPELTKGEPLPAIVFGGELPVFHAPALRPLAPGDEDRPGALIAIGESALATGPEFLRAKGNPDAERLENLRAALLSRGERVESIGGSIGVWRITTGPQESP
ncbi:MAG: hypothetical protein DIJKHBIC_02501 [Thermoanaerobaculia bacterium]|nr:hypothetical protein [Thermoanaerobaculia bacterium]